MADKTDLLLWWHIVLTNMLVIIGSYDCPEADSPQGFYIQGSGNWMEARLCCQSRGHSLPVIRNTLDFNHVTSVMKHHNITSAWLSLQRVHLGKFFWTSCNKAYGRFEKEKWLNTSNCGYINVRDTHLAAGMCSSARGVVCEVQDCSRCELTNCERIKDRCYVKSCTRWNWEAGRAYCRSHGWDLADLGSDQSILEAISSKWKDKGCDFMYIGLRREEWVYLSSKPSVLTSVYWHEYEPALKGDCAVIKKVTEGYRWHAVSCKDKYPVVCMNFGSQDRSHETERSTVTGHVTQKPSTKTNTDVDASSTPIPHTVWVHIASQWSVVVLTFVIIGFFMVIGASFFFYKKIMKNIKESVNCLTNEQEEQQPLQTVKKEDRHLTESMRRTGRPNDSSEEAAAFEGGGTSTQKPEDEIHLTVRTDS